MSLPQDDQKAPLDGEALRRGAVEIVERRRRGLPGYRGTGAPQPAVAVAADALRALNEGQQHLDAGRLAEALLRADKAIGLAPTHDNLRADGWALRGAVHLSKANPQAARSDLDRALALNPAHLQARLLLADAYRRMNQPARAVPLYLESFALATEERERERVQLLLADTYRAAGQPGAARRVLHLASGGQGLTPKGRLHTLRALLPASAPEWVILLLLLAAAGGMAARIGAGAYATALMVAAGLALFAALQWWHIPR